MSSPSTLGGNDHTNSHPQPFTPTQFINDLRLDYAANLLAHSDLAVVDIALEVGFEGLSYFYRRFKGKFGQTPNDYRVSHKRPSPIDPI